MNNKSLNDLIPKVLKEGKYEIDPMSIHVDGGGHVYAKYGSLYCYVTIAIPVDEVSESVYKLKEDK